jgi:hypothetical protein
VAGIAFGVSTRLAGNHGAFAFFRVS